MKIIGINGSPRTRWNTAQLVKSALDGADSVGAETRLYHLYEHDFKGCISCFSCLRLDAPTFGRCRYDDACKDILDEVLASDGLILGSPVYFHDLTASVRAFLERLWFGGLVYSKDRNKVYERTIPVRIFLTMNVPFPDFYAKLKSDTIEVMERFMGPTEIIEITDTWQFSDYSLYAADFFDVDRKKQRHEEVFPRDLENAFETGKKLADLNTTSPNE